jgi:hypothetical protein
MPTETIPLRAGEASALLDSPDAALRAYALFAHCFTWRQPIG